MNKSSIVKSLIVLCPLLFFSCNNGATENLDTDIVTNSASADKKNNETLPEIKFDEEVFDFGKITQGERVSHAFKFQNIGKKNLIISGASGSCGCTVPEWPQEPIKQGGEGVINVVFNSEGKSGLQEKAITVVTNCEPATRVIRIRTEIIIPETSN